MTGGGVTWVFADLVDRLVKLVEADVIVTERPLPEADVYHFWRPQAAINEPDLSRAVLTCHGFGYWGANNPIYTTEVIRAFARAKAAIALNSADAIVIGSHTRIIPHAVDPEVFTLRPPHNPREKLVIGRVGRPYGPPDDPNTGVECKGTATLHEIMRGLVPQRDAIKWLFLGTGWEREEGVAKSLGFEVEFRRRDEVGYPHGYVLAYHAMDVFLVTSRSEGGPASLPEAMACGVLPVATPVGMCRDLMVGRGNWLYNVNRHDRAIERLVACAKLKLQNETKLYGGLDEWRNTLRAAVKDWTWTRWAEAHTTLYKAVSQVTT